jgi:hypothetical protein
LQIAGAYPVELFQQLDEDWRKYVTQLHRDGLDFVVPPVLAIVLSRCASRDAVPSVLRDLREEWSDARQKVWHSLDRLRTARTLGEAIEIRRELSEASKSFAPEPTEHDSRPMRVFWEIITAAGMGAGILALSGGKPAIGAITGAMTQVPRSVPALLHDFGPAVFGRGAFDLARRVRRALSQVELDALTRLLSKTEKRRLGFG